MGNYEPYLDSLRDEGQKSYWAVNTEAIKLALARGPIVAEAVRGAIGSKRSEDAADLYQFLVGFTPDQLTAGGAAKQCDAFGTRQA